MKAYWKDHYVTQTDPDEGASAAGATNMTLVPREWPSAGETTPLPRPLVVESPSRLSSYCHSAERGALTRVLLAHPSESV